MDLAPTIITQGLTRRFGDLIAVDGDEISEAASQALGDDGGSEIHEEFESSTGGLPSRSECIQETKTPRLAARALLGGTAANLKQIPEELVVDVVVILHLGRFHERSQQTRTPIGGSLLQIRVPALHIFAENFRRPL